VRVSDVRTWRDYVYYREDLQFFAGRRYSGQRNHINKFRSKWPDAQFRPLTAADAPVIEQFWQDYEAEFPKDSNAKAKNELELAKKMLKMTGKPYFFTGGMFDGEKLIALSLAEKCGDTLIIHIEKALYSYTGVYPALVQAFADAFGDGCQWINREDDAADKGLRTSKLQYGPARLAPKYRFDPQNELLNHVQAIPELKTERLTLSALTEADIPAYNALVLDADRNRWWGYDDVGGLGGRVEERSFFDVAKRDFENRQAVNFAVRLDGKLIGEAVLYRFDCRGGAELGCRIDKAYAGNGYGTEAFAAVAEWGLYKIHLSRVVAKCYKENQASYKMLSACMRKKGEDDTFFYFEKLV
jgi:RimJ/RimL family protein N-acetyltransferase